MKPKCKYCGELATKKTAFFSLSYDNLPFWKRVFRRARYGQFWSIAVCEKHYLEFSHGIETVVCKNCGERTLFHSHDFYSDKELYCSFCKTKIEGEED